MFGWEFPPHIAGGLGTACYGMTRGLAQHGVKVIFVMPKAYGDEDQQFVRVVNASDVETLYGDPKQKDIWEKMTFIHINSNMVPYISPEEFADYSEQVRNGGTVPVGGDLWKERYSFSGTYGANLMEEIARYAMVAAQLAKDLAGQFDVIHAHDWLTYYAGIAAKRVSGKPLVVHMHATEFDRSGENVNQQVYNIERAGMAAADRVIAVSNLTRNIVINKYGIAPDRVVAVHNAVRFASQELEAEERGVDDKIVTFLGRITYQKGPDYFVEAAAKVLKRGRLRDALEEALGRSDVVITTGGLGPTDDDLTKETIASVAGAPLKIHEDSLRRLESYFKGRPAMGENQRKQAMLPEGATVFPNDIGTAPGCGVRTASGKVIVMLPGPPSELVPMLQHYVVPFLKEGSHAVIHSCMIRTFGLGEGAGALKIADLTDAANPTAATYAKENEMFVRVTARAESEEAAEALCRPVVEEICRRYGDVVYGVDVDNLESVVVRLLSEKGLHLATAESCTGGLVAKLITDVSGASEVFGMGLVTYANEAKMKLLGVPAAMLEEHGAVSEPVARAMAEGVREVSGSELGIGITGVAGPTGGTPEKPVGLIYIALSDGTRTWVRRMTPPGRVHGRGWLRDRAAGTALDMVRRYLSDLPLEPVQSAGPATTL